MRAFILAIIALAAISIGANYGLKMAGFSAAEQSTGGSVRLSD